MESVKEEAIKRGYTSLPYNKLYMKYKNTKGLVKGICAELMVDALTRDSKMVAEDDLDDFLTTIELDSLWHLALDSKNQHVKEEAKTRIIAILVNEENKEMLEEKIVLDKMEEEKKARVLSLHK
jgi:hypothetical protein